MRTWTVAVHEGIHGVVGTGGRVMVGHSGGPLLARRLGVLGILLVALVVGVVALAGGGTAGAARPTSALVGDYGSAQVSLSAGAINFNLNKGLVGKVVLNTAPGAHVAYVVHFTGSTTPVQGTAQADKKGVLTITFKAPASAAASAPVSGTLQVHITDPGKQGTATVQFHALPMLLFSTQTKIAHAAGGVSLTISVQVAAGTHVSVGVTMPGAKKPAFSANGV